MAASRIEYLLARYVNKNCTSEEKKELMELIRLPENETSVKSLIQNIVHDCGAEIELADERADLILTGILKYNNVIVPMRKPNTVFRSWMQVAAAVFIIVMAGVSYWLLQKNGRNDNNKSASIITKPAIILPGTDKALLTMNDGSTVVLDSVQNAVLVQPGNANIQKQGSVLLYNLANPANSESSIAFNTLSTPRGGQYRVVLSDGSQVWLNAASSLRFPTVFAGNGREVELTGEAYFEVAKNKRMPFHVRVNGIRVDVLGTHFNINAYSEEQDIKTSLLEGSVRVVNGSFDGFIKPGEQAIVSGKNDIVNIKTANMDAVVAWKNGLFEFEGADITTIMRQVARWYDVEIIYTAKVPLRRFEGKISRNAQLSDVLRILALSNIKFEVEGKKIIVQ